MSTSMPLRFDPNRSKWAKINPCLECDKQGSANCPFCIRAKIHESAQAGMKEIEL